MPAPIPLSRPDISQHEIDAVVEVLNTPTLSIGPRLDEFEAAIARRVGRRHAVGVSSGTAGLHCALLAAGIGPGDQVITTPFSFVASANCILYVGATPVFVDIDPQSLNIDVGKVEAAITPRTRAIVGVEVFGNPTGMPQLEHLARRHELVLVEDCCEGLGGSIEGRAIGSFGRVGVFGFYPNKQITTGEGGMIVTDDDRLADACRALRNQGRTGMSWLSHEILGYNYRLSEINAALGLAQLTRLDRLLENRRRVAAAYIDRLMTCRYLILPNVIDPATMSWFVFVVRLSDLFTAADRDAIIAGLREQGIGASNYFPPIHLQPYMAQRFGFKPGDFPVCEFVSARTIALPFFSQMSNFQVGRVCATLETLLEKRLTSGNRRF